jgi:GDP-L-fucose synthase
MRKEAPIWVMGASGLAGGAIVRALRNAGHSQVRTDRVDLTDAAVVRTKIDLMRPELIVVAAGYVGGIVANAAQQADFLLENAAIAVSVLREARRAAVPRLLYLGSSCAYPRHAAQPIREDAILSGMLEPTNRGYAVAKLTGVEAVLSVRLQDNLDWCALMPSNLYGPGDNYDVHRSHVVAALIRKIHAAKIGQDAFVRLLGTGQALREFLYVDDFADAALRLINEPGGFPYGVINVGTGHDLRIAELAGQVAKVVGYHGDIVFDNRAPDGTPRKLLDIGRVRSIGWQPRTQLADGLARAYQDFLQREEACLAIS